MNLKRSFARPLQAAHLALVGYMARAGLIAFANYQSDNVKGLVPSPIAMGQEAVPLRGEITPSSFTTADVLEMLEIPPGMQVVDWTVDTDDLDSNGAPAAVFKLGVLNAGKTDLDTGNAIWKTGLTTAQASGVARMDTVTAIRAGASTSRRIVGIVPTTNAATFQSGKIAVTVWLKAA